MASFEGELARSSRVKAGYVFGLLAYGTSGSASFGLTIENLGFSADKISTESSLAWARIRADSHRFHARQASALLLRRRDLLFPDGRPAAVTATNMLLIGASTHF